MKNDIKKILVVDDEQKIVDVVKSYLEHSGFIVHCAYDGTTALSLFEKTNPSLVVLDLMLPDFSGEEICKIIRKKSAVPIIMLTAKVGEESILTGLNIGADDYISKPFSPKELVARVNAVLRRFSYDPIMQTSVVSYNNGDLVINNLTYEVSKNGELVNLTPIEYKLLLTIAKYPHKTFTREELIVLTMGDDYDGYDRTVDVHIKNLRHKIENDPKKPKYILTVHGFGYKFGGDNNEN